MSRFTIPRDLYYGDNAMEELKNLKGYKKAIIVTGGSSMKRGGFLDKCEKILKDTGLEVKIFDGVEPDPSIETVYKGAEAMREFNPDVIVALGGGSALDAAKAMWVFYEYPEKKFDDIKTPFTKHLLLCLNLERKLFLLLFLLQAVQLQKLQLSQL